MAPRGSAPDAPADGGDGRPRHGEPGWHGDHASDHHLLEHHHRDIHGGAARAAVFGVSDGLVSNLALVLGVAGASPSRGVVLLAGLAGLVAGSCSMASGEYVSMSAQRELLQRELDMEAREIDRRPDHERRELAAIYRSKGVDAGTADAMATQMMRNPALALETHAREELGIDPSRLGSPLTAAASSFLAFAIGALVPLVPWLLTGGAAAVVASLVLSVVGAVAIGVALARATGRPWPRTAGRQVALAGLAAAVSTAVGLAVGATGVLG